MMTARLEVVAKPGARASGISRRGTDVIVAVRERAIDGRANEAVVRAVAAWLDLAPSRVTLLRGASARRKLLACEGIDEACLAQRIGNLDG
ncbi:MAG: hypothetical protein JWO85_3427 [Candidatus Eremiobacteraeota bacterium]|jgi:uncharacterized protein YggU (UPF0235/DUF167 family)|nr:hypothetical protein [Candidatus Eremiobacteraeota bacterium]